MPRLRLADVKIPGIAIYKSFKDLDFKNRLPFRYLVMAVGLIVLVAIRHEVHLFVLFLTYAVLGAVFGIFNLGRKTIRPSVYSPSQVKDDPDLIEEEVRNALIQRYGTTLINPVIHSLTKVSNPKQAEKHVFTELIDLKIKKEIFKSDYTRIDTVILGLKKILIPIYHIKFLKNFWKNYYVVSVKNLKKLQRIFHTNKLFLLGFRIIKINYPCQICVIFNIY